MKKREFNKWLKVITTKNRLDISKINNLPNEVRADMVYFIISKRQPVIKDLIPEGFDMSWMHAMGYLYETRMNGYDLVHLCTFTLVAHLQE
jgi:hypothetical protein